MTPIGIEKYKKIAANRNADPALRCLAMDVAAELEKLEAMLAKKDVEYIAPLPTENPFVAKLGLGITEYPVLGELKPRVSPAMIFGGASKREISNVPPTFQHWMKYQKVKLKPGDKRYQKYYARYRKFKAEFKKNSYTK